MALFSLHVANLAKTKHTINDLGRRKCNSQEKEKEEKTKKSRQNAVTDTKAKNSALQ